MTAGLVVIGLLPASVPVAVRPGRERQLPRRDPGQALRLLAVMPAIVALDQRRRHGLGPIPPRGDLGYAANFLYMTFGKVPKPQITAAFQTSLILYAEHSFNASTFTPVFAAARLPG